MTRLIERPVDRRTLARGAAWSVPVMASASMAPAFASSQCTASLATSTVTSISGNVILITMTTSSGSVYTVRMTTTAAANTRLAPQNLTQGNVGTAGASGSGCGTVISGAFGPPDAIILNQQVQRNASCTPAAGTNSQSIVFDFFVGADTSGPSFVPEDFRISIFDISSSNSSNSNRRYWDTIGFSLTPNSISSNLSCAAGTGAGTLASPFRRTSNDATSGTCPSLFREVFQFNTFPSGTTMTYGNNGQNGWQFISIDNIRFTAPC